MPSFWPRWCDAAQLQSEQSGHVQRSQHLKWLLYNPSIWNSATTCRPANHLPCRAFCAAAHISWEPNFKYTKPCTTSTSAQSTGESGVQEQPCIACMHLFVPYRGQALNDVRSSAAAPVCLPCTPFSEHGTQPVRVGMMYARVSQHGRAICKRGSARYTATCIKAVDWCSADSIPGCCGPHSGGQQCQTCCTHS